MRSVQNSVKFNSVQSINSLPLNLNRVWVGGAYPAIIGRQYTLDRLYSHSHLFNSTQFNLHTLSHNNSQLKGLECKDANTVYRWGWCWVTHLGWLWLRKLSGASTNRRVGGLIPSFFTLHTKVSLGKILNPELLQMHSSGCKWSWMNERCTCRKKWMCKWVNVKCCLQH